MPPSATPQLYVAGIGASAGGLEAMLPLFAHLPVTGRVAYVVAQHMAHDAHSDLVARLIERESRLPVAVAHDGETLQADRVYLVPAGKDGIVQGNTLTLHEPAPEYLSHPSVNALLASIAHAHRGNAIGIVLSGTGSDGLAGCRAVKTAGGLTLAQDPLEAKFNGMPTAAIEARLIDRVLPVDAIGEALAKLFPGTAVIPPPPVEATPVPPQTLPAAELRELEYLVRLVHEATGIDFSGYKEETLLRRLEKRKALLGIASAEAYLAQIRRTPDELHILQHLFLVSLSSFFRDRDSFRELEHALAAMIATKPDGEPLRVWVPGCASGEEPYTLAIILCELLGDYRSRHPVSIVATDLNEAALEIARTGCYRQTALREMAVPLQERYLIRKGQHFAVSNTLRAMVSFERRDVFSGAPGSDMDLISCRNLLIYLKGHLQDRLVSSFFQALRPNGLLFIGQSESPGLGSNAQFVPVDRYHRLFRRRP